MTEREYLRHLNKSAQKFFRLRQTATRTHRNAAPGQALPQDQGAAHQAAAPFRYFQRRGICRMRSDMIDLIVRLLWDESVAALSPEARAKLNVSVTAHGGYGRRVMSPGSDVDLTFMFPGTAARCPPKSCSSSATTCSTSTI